jgi:hypothetical protein
MPRHTDRCTKCGRFIVVDDDNGLCPVCELKLGVGVSPPSLPPEEAPNRPDSHLMVWMGYGHLMIWRWP